MDDLTVLNVLVTTPEPRGGGAVRAGLQLGKHLAEFAIVDTVKMEGNHDEEIAREFDMIGEVQPIPSKTLLRDVCDAVMDFDDNFSNVLIWTRLCPPRPLESYDVVHIHNAVPLAGMVSAAISCRRAGVPYCVTTHGISKIPDLPREMHLSRGARLVFRNCFLKPYLWVLKNAAHLFALSEEDERRLHEEFSDVSISVIPNGVELKRQAEMVPERAEEITNIPPSRPMLLFVGKIRQSKGINDLLDAYQMLNTDTALVVVGPTQDEELRERIRTFDDSEVQYQGYVSRENLDIMFHRADLFVFPTRSDVFPLVNLEAMAASTPVISTTVGGIPEQIDGSSGVLVPPNDPGALAAAISNLLNDEARREKLASGARERAIEKFSWTNVAKRTVQDYRKCLT